MRRKHTPREGRAGQMKFHVMLAGEPQLLCGAWHLYALCVRKLTAVCLFATPQVRVKCNEDDTIGDLKKLIAAQVGTRPEKIRIQKWYTIYKVKASLGLSCMRPVRGRAKCLGGSSESSFVLSRCGCPEGGGMKQVQQEWIGRIVQSWTARGCGIEDVRSPTRASSSIGRNTFFSENDHLFANPKHFAMALPLCLAAATRLAWPPPGVYHHTQPRKRQAPHANPCCRARFARTTSLSRTTRFTTEWD